MDRRDFLKGFGLVPLALLLAAKLSESREEYVITTVSADSFVLQTNQDGFTTEMKRPDGSSIVGCDVEIRNTLTGKSLHPVTKYVHDTRYLESVVELWEELPIKDRRTDIGCRMQSYKMRNVGLWDCKGRRWLV